MTVTYNAEVATVKGFGCFLKLLARWRGSIYKLVWLDLIMFLSIYYGLSIIYRYILEDAEKRTFEAIVKYCDDYSNLIPLSFVLGFYVSVIMARWWNQYLNIPHPDPVAVFVSATVHGHDERGRVMRRTIMRYVCLCVTMVFTMISPRVKKRFPTLDHFVDAGLLQTSEKEIMEDLNNKFPKYSKHWLPLVWASSIVTRARKEGRIRDDFAVKTIIDELNKFRGKCGVLLTYDHINIPLVYTQVVTLAVYSYFLTNVMAHQWTEGNKYKFDLYFPIFTTLQFFFYIGWLKVAESMINPFGDDDDDFEVNWMVDRNLQVSYMIVDEMHHDHPELVRDQYWDEKFPQELPSTVAARAIRDSYPLPSTANIASRPQDQEIMTNLPKMEDMQSYTGLDGGPITFSAKPRPYSFRSKGSQISLGTTVPDTISRHNSVTNMLKRFFSRDESKPEEKLESNEMNNLLGDPFPKAIGSIKKITDQVIEEVDEQNTINSQRSAKEARPSVINFFGPPSPTTPINVPNARGNCLESRGIDVYDPFPRISTSAPGTSTDGKIQDDAENVSIGGSVTDEEDDEFTRLKKTREEERLSRLKSSLSRSLSIRPEEHELLLGKCSDKTVTPQSHLTHQ